MRMYLDMLNSSASIAFKLIFSITFSAILI